MTAAVAKAGSVTRPVPRQQLVRALVGSTLGTTLVWYDLFLYAFAVMLVLGGRFFPTGAPLAGGVMALATYLVGFGARPVGAALLGRLGDRIGRRATLIATLWLAGLATALIGLVPTYAQIGVWAAILLTVLRVIQGMAAGGEWAGSVLLSIEWAETRGVGRSGFAGAGGRGDTSPLRSPRGLIGSFTQLAMPAGFLLAFGALQLSTALLGADSYWGWRVPFIASLLMVLVGLYVRLGTQETPVFKEVFDRGRIEAAPLQQTFAKHWAEVSLCALARTGQEAPFYVFTFFVVTYATSKLGFQQAGLSRILLAGTAASLATTLLWGHLSDRIGRRRLYLIGAAAMVIWALVYWGLVDTGVQILVFGAMILALPIHDIQNGPQAALIAERFTARLRYTGASLGYSLAALTAGGPALVIPAALFGAFHRSLPIAIYTAVSAAIGLGATALMRDRSGSELTA